MGLSCGWSTELFLDGPLRGCEGSSTHSVPLACQLLRPGKGRDSILETSEKKENKVCFYPSTQGSESQTLEGLRSQMKGWKQELGWCWGEGSQNLKGFKRGKAFQRNAS